ncbi:MAG: hypothetical protein J6W40_03965 [Alphaproteobacteria bacterium]|nr:hypothetical protein [Alphaproteobacteria bacterium]
MLFLLPAHADVLPLDSALRATYTACVGIDDDLSDLKKMAGINTAVTGVGTAVGAGATVVGIVKANKDAKAEELEQLIKELHDMEDGKEPPTETQKQAFLKEVEESYDTAIKDITTAQAELEKLNKQSKSLGNWRTGLMAGGTATNIAGAIIAGNNKVDADLQTQIDSCRTAVHELRSSIMQARMNGEDVSEAEEIASACGEYDYVDVSPINKRGKGAMVSSIVGATTGVAGTVTSAMANTDATRNDNTDAGKQKEKNLNTASNILAGATTAASATATVFNATQISAIKKVATVAEKCTGVLK